MEQNVGIEFQKKGYLKNVWVKALPYAQILSRHQRCRSSQITFRHPFTVATKSFSSHSFLGFQKKKNGILKKFFYISKCCNCCRCCYLATLLLTNDDYGRKRWDKIGSLLLLFIFFSRDRLFC